MASTCAVCGCKVQGNASAIFTSLKSSRSFQVFRNPVCGECDKVARWVNSMDLRSGAIVDRAIGGAPGESSVATGAI